MDDSLHMSMYCKAQISIPYLKSVRFSVIEIERLRGASRIRIIRHNHKFHDTSSYDPLKLASYLSSHDLMANINLEEAGNAL